MSRTNVPAGGFVLELHSNPHLFQELMTLALRYSNEEYLMASANVLANLIRAYNGPAEPIIDTFVSCVRECIEEGKAGKLTKLPLD